MLADGEVVGRIYEPAGSRFDPPELRWFWSVMVTPATPGVTSGTAATRGSSTSIYNERGQLTGRAERRPDGSTSFFKRAWPVRRLDPTTLTRERNHMSRYLLVLVALLATSAAAAAEIPSHMRGKWCGVPDDTYVKGPCGDGSLDTDVEMTVTATGFKVNDTECKAIQVTRGAIKNPRSTPSYRFKFRCSDGKISEQEWWIEKDSYLLIDVKRRSSAEPSNPWGVAIENILVETVTRVTIYGSACAQIPDWLREAGAKVIEDIKRQKAAHKLDTAYLQMVKEKDKMGADAWCASAKPHIDDFLKIQPPTPER